MGRQIKNYYTNQCYLLTHFQHYVPNKQTKYLAYSHVQTVRAGEGCQHLMLMEVKLRVLLLSSSHSYAWNNQRAILSRVVTRTYRALHLQWLILRREQEGYWDFTVKLTTRLHMTTRSWTRGITYSPHTSLRLTATLPRAKRSSGLLVWTDYGNGKKVEFLTN
jgi:hypothetical protein